MVIVKFQENDNTPVEHTPTNPPSQLWKESLYSLLVKVAWGVFQGCVETTLDNGILKKKTREIGWMS